MLTTALVLNRWLPWCTLPGRVGPIAARQALRLAA